MYGDFSRVLDGVSGGYSSVLAQQGRFLLDAELNEQSAILLDYLRRLTTDLVGPFAGPVHHCGFEVEPVPVAGEPKCHQVRLGRGHYYVYGLRCESPPPGRPVDEPFEVPEQEEPFVVYLLVWEQAISAVQAPELADPALGNGVPDTTRRSQVRWRPLAARRLPGARELTRAGGGRDHPRLPRIQRRPAAATDARSSRPRHRAARSRSGHRPDRGRLPRRREPALPG